MTRRIEPATLLGLWWMLLAGVIYWLSAHNFDSGRDDFFYLSDAFLHGRTWLESPIGPNDTIRFGGHFYVPFAPFPAIAFMPLIALVGPETADLHGPLINAVLAAVVVGLAWMLTGRLGVRDLVHRTFLIALLGFSTTLWWVTTRGGVWHTGQIIATILTLGCLVELWGRQRPPLIGLLAGAAFLTRAPLAFAVPFYMLLIEPYPLRAPFAAAADSLRAWADRLPVWEWISLGLGTVPAIAFFFWYNDLRFGSPFESGYGLAVLPEWLEARRELGLFSLAHVGWNVDLLFFKLPNQIPEFPWFKPDGLGMSVLFTSPALLLAFRAPWRDRRTWWLLGAAIVVLIPTLLYYGGGWLQYGYRYFLDSIPFLVAMAGLAVARYGLHWIWWPLLLWGLWINAMGVYWVDKI